jgi:hypothetical protein
MSTSQFTAIAARADFQRARRDHLATRAWRWLTGRRANPTRPRDLADVAILLRSPSRPRPIPLDAIVGTVDPTTDFDVDLRPATDRVSSRWQRVARAHHDGRALPPITVIERPDGYYILDGRHRVSVARALGHDHIDAWASPAHPPCRLPELPTEQRRPCWDPGSASPHGPGSMRLRRPSAGQSSGYTGPDHGARAAGVVARTESARPTTGTPGSPNIRRQAIRSE